MDNHRKYWRYETQVTEENDEKLRDTHTKMDGRVQKILGIVRKKKL